MAYDPLILGAEREALSASLRKIDTMIEELYSTTYEGDLSAITQNIVPGTDNVYTLGSPTNRFNHLYVGPGSITIGDAVITATVGGKVIVPGVTQPATYVVDRVVAVDAPQEQTWLEAPVVIDQFTYLNLINPIDNPAPVDWSPAYYVAPIDSNGLITNIIVQLRGNNYSGIEINGVNDITVICTDYMMAAPAGTTLDPFNVEKWIPIPFYVVCGIGETTGDPTFSGTGNVTFTSDVISVNSSSMFGYPVLQNRVNSEGGVEIDYTSDTVNHAMWLNGNDGLTIHLNSSDEVNTHRWQFAPDGVLYFDMQPFTSGIALTDISVTTAAASSGGSLSYDNSTGAFTFAPADLSAKQNTLVSGTNIKTINGVSLLGSGDISVGGGGSTFDQSLNTTDSVEFASVTTASLSVDTFTSTGAGTPAIESATTVTISTANNAYQWIYDTAGTLSVPGALQLKVFDSTVSRDAAYPTPTAGLMVMVSTATQVYDGSAWKTLVYA